MPFLSSTPGDFKVEIPRPFIPKSIKDRYTPYLTKLPSIICDVSDMVNHSIQTVTIPPASYEPVSQVNTSRIGGDDSVSTGGNAIQGGFSSSSRFRAAINPGSLIERSFTITFKLIDGYFNYWVMQDTFWYYYDFANTQTYTWNIPIRIIDSKGLILFSAQYTDVLFTGLSEFSLSSADNVQQFTTFDATFTFNKFVTQTTLD